MVHRVHDPGYLPSNAEQARIQNVDPAYTYRADQVEYGKTYRRQERDALYDIIVELMDRNEAVNAWAIEHGGHQLPPIKALGCRCNVHINVRARIKELMARRAAKPKAGG